MSDDTIPALNVRLNADMPAQQMRLHMGEISAGEMRVARAAIRWANRHAADEIASLRARLAEMEGLISEALEGVHHGDREEWFRRARAALEGQT